VLDFQATDAVGMRVQSAAKVAALPSVTAGRGVESASKGVNVV